MVSCQDELRLNNKWFGNCEWKTWDMLEEIVKCYGNGTGSQVVCLQGSSDFIIEVTKVITIG